MGRNLWALCNIGKTSVEGLIFCPTAQEHYEPTGVSAVGNKAGQRTGKTEEAGVVHAREKKAEDSHAKTLHILKRNCKEKGNHLFLVGRVRCNGLKLHQGEKAFLMVTLVRHSFISQSVMVSLLLDVFKYVLDKY